MGRLRQLSEALLATCFPTLCRLCGQLVAERQHGITCQSCWDQFNLCARTQQLCQRCGFPWPSAALPPRQCRYCRLLTFNYCRAAGPYIGPLRVNLWRLKRAPILPGRLVDLLVSTYQDNQSYLTSDLIMPVPLHPERFTRRGFNQAELIAQALADAVRLPVDTDSLIRIKATAKHRAGMDQRDRQASVANAFQVVRPRLISGARILLVDDLFTTGSTLSSCAERLLAAGAQAVNLLTLARVIADSDQFDQDLNE